MITYPKYPILIEGVNYKDYKNASLYLTRFVEKDLPVLFIGNADEESVYVICNINPDDSYNLCEFELAIKDYSENEGTLDWLIKGGYVNEPHSNYVGGWVSVPVCKMTDKLIKIIIEKCQ